MSASTRNIWILVYLIVNKFHHQVYGCGTKRISCLSETSYKFCFSSGKVTMDIGNIKYCPKATLCDENHGILPCLYLPSTSTTEPVHFSTGIMDNVYEDGQNLITPQEEINEILSTEKIFHYMFTDYDESTKYNVETPKTTKKDESYIDFLSQDLSSTILNEGELSTFTSLIDSNMVTDNFTGIFKPEEFISVTTKVIPHEEEINNRTSTENIFAATHFFSHYETSTKHNITTPNPSEEENSIDFLNQELSSTGLNKQEFIPTIISLTNNDMVTEASEETEEISLTTLSDYVLEKPIINTIYTPISINNFENGDSFSTTPTHNQEESIDLTVNDELILTGYFRPPFSTTTMPPENQTLTTYFFPKDEIDLTGTIPEDHENIESSVIDTSNSTADDNKTEIIKHDNRKTIIVSFEGIVPTVPSSMTTETPEIDFPQLITTEGNSNYIPRYKIPITETPTIQISKTGMTASTKNNTKYTQTERSTTTTTTKKTTSSNTTIFNMDIAETTTKDTTSTSTRTVLQSPIIVPINLGIIGILMAAPEMTTKTKLDTTASSVPSFRTDFSTASTTTSTENGIIPSLRTNFSIPSTTTPTTKASPPVCNTTGKYPSEICNRYYECVRIMWWFQLRVRTCRFGESFNSATLTCQFDNTCRTKLNILVN